MRYSNVSVRSRAHRVCSAWRRCPIAGARAGWRAGRASTMACSQGDDTDRRHRPAGSPDRRLPHVVVSGSGNRVVVERVGSLNVSGMDNEVRWERSLQGEAPRVVTPASRTSCTRVTPAADAGPRRQCAAGEKPRRHPAPAPASAPRRRPTTPPRARRRRQRSRGPRQDGRTAGGEAERPDAAPRLRVAAGDRERQHQHHYA